MRLLQFNDDQLKWNRLDFIKLCDLEQVEAFVQSGYAYAERTDAAGEYWRRLWAGARCGWVSGACALV